MAAKLAANSCTTIVAARPGPWVWTPADGAGRVGEVATTLFKDTTYSVFGLIEDIKQGEVALPDIQRPFVWGASKVRDLLDSMYKGFPVGYLLFWETGAEAGARQIGVDLKQKAPRLLIVDGQQRLTALYAVITGSKVLKSDYTESRVRIAFRPGARSPSCGELYTARPFLCTFPYTGGAHPLRVYGRCPDAASIIKKDPQRARYVGHDHCVDPAHAVHEPPLTDRSDVLAPSVGNCVEAVHRVRLDLDTGREAVSRAGQREHREGRSVLVPAVGGHHERRPDLALLVADRYAEVDEPDLAPSSPTHAQARRRRSTPKRGRRRARRGVRPRLRVFAARIRRARAPPAPGLRRRRWSCHAQRPAQPHGLAWLPRRGRLLPWSKHTAAHAYPHTCQRR